MLPEEAKELKQTLLWDVFCKELETMIETERGRLENASEERVKMIQERIRTLRNIKKLPQDIIDREGGGEE